MNRKITIPSSGNVAIVGRPNVGKSALFNRLAGKNIAIVHDQPGVTRDRLTTQSRRGARPFMIWDTGGIGGAGETDLIEQVHRAAEEAIRESDLILFLVDAQQGLTPVDRDLAGRLRRSRRPIVLVVNKVDHPKHQNLETDFAALGFRNTIAISAAHGLGIDELLEIIDQLLPPTPSSDQRSEFRRPLALAVIGRPNVGKSSLINTILRDDRTIVSELPGTTRDTVDIGYERDGEQFVLIDTAGMRARSKHSTSVEVFSVMRAERSVRRADLCVLVIDLRSGVTAQDKKIAALIQKAQKPCLIVLNKCDLVMSGRNVRRVTTRLITEARERLFFLDYAPLLIASALTGQNLEQFFGLIKKIERAARVHIGTGLLNRLLRSAMANNPPPIISNKRLKLFYATQPIGESDVAIPPPEFILFVNNPKLLGETYERYLIGRIREIRPYPGLPILVKCRARSDKIQP